MGILALSADERVQDVTDTMKSWSRWAAIVFAAMVFAPLLPPAAGIGSHLSACGAVADDHSDAIRIILDTDMESDVDDVGALAMLHALADFGETAILGVMVCAKNPWSILCADRINTYFKREQLPLGQLRGPGVDRESRYARGVAEEFPGTLQRADEAPDAVVQYRRILAAQPDNSVVILSIGYLTNLRDLIDSGPDPYSNLDGRRLVEQKVRLWICMGGQFPSGREANLRWDTVASMEAIAKWPGEIIFSGWEIGLMDSGADILDLPESNPVRRAYQLFGRIPHKNWDQVAVLYAVRGLDDGPAARYWELSGSGRLVIDPSDGSNTWEDDPSGPHRHLLQKGSDEAIAREIDALMMYVPGSSR
jgi:purine nucleosidase